MNSSSPCTNTYWPGPAKLLVIFVHGFNGSDHTFGDFPTQLQAILQPWIPGMSVECIIYPTTSTMGKLSCFVGCFSRWLNDKIEKNEASAGSVKVVLCGHSMGGIVIADALRTSRSGQNSPKLWARTIACIAFDTPYFGINKALMKAGVAALGLSLLSHVGGMVAVGASAVGVGASDHLRFVSELINKGSLAERMKDLISFHKEGVTMFHTFYVKSPSAPLCTTFIKLPKDDNPATVHFSPVINPKAHLTIAGHTGMFSAKKNAGYGQLQMETVNIILKALS